MSFKHLNVKYRFKEVFRYFMIISACAAVLLICGCLGGPRRRLGCLPTSTFGTRFISANKLGTHSYGFSPFENNGIIYTCRGGHIDIAHLRIAADNTRFVVKKLYKSIMANKKGFSFSLPGDHSKHVVQIHYPENWDVSDQEAIAWEISLEVGQYLVFSATTWHEMLTWYGYRTMMVFPEFSSAFSWEDIYSNLLGTRIAAKALQDTEHSYNKAVTLALNKELEILSGQPGIVAKRAAEKMRGEWFKGNIFVSVIKKNLDIGFDDGYVTPVIVPGVCEEAEPLLYPVPSANALRHGFSIDYEIHPREIEKTKLLNIVHSRSKGKTIEPMVHFSAIMSEIRRTAIAKFGPEADVGYGSDDVLKPETFGRTFASASYKNTSLDDITSEISTLLRTIKARMSN